MAFLSLSVLVFLWVLITAGLAEIVSLKGLQRDRSGIFFKRPESIFGYRFLPPLSASSSAGAENRDELELLDIVLLASVDGKFHALNRTSGQPLWSMSSSAVPGATPSSFAPLVRTVHVETDPDLTDDDSPNEELYIVEPQSGDIYVMSSPNSPLQRLHLSMSQLVDLSPFSFAGGADSRIFVGKKATSLILLELETGRVKATLNSECPWDPFGDLRGPIPKDPDLDDLEGTSPILEVPNLTEIFIGRTDYHISIITPRSSSPVQNISFSSYGPNNQDMALQSAYHRTPDDIYIQSLPNGAIIALKAVAADGSEPSTSPFRWHHKFKSPIVAVFDVLKAPGRQQPIALLQPRPRLQDVLPGRMDHLPNIDSAYVGLVEETGSLYAMSPDHFPLVIFSDADADNTSPWLIEGGSESNSGLPARAKPNTRRRKPEQSCRNGSPNRMCLTGVRPLAEDSRSRFSRLLDGAPSVEPPPEGIAQQYGLVNRTAASDSRSWSNLSIVPPWIWKGNNNSSSGQEVPFGIDGSKNTFSVGSLIAALVLGLVFIIFRRRKSQKSRQTATEPATVSAESVDRTSPVASLQKLLDSLPPTQERPPPLPPNGVPSAVSPEVDVVSPEDPKGPELKLANGREEQNDWEDSEKEGDGVAVPGKRKPRRGKRGKKKKVTLLTGDEDEQEREKEKPPNENGNVVEIEMPLEAHANPGPLPVSPTPQPTTTEPSLIVSETILGYGSHGTVVFRGSLQGRSVAVKRLLKDFVTLASREVSILQESDYHPNVIRYYYQEAHANFLYIALELCPASLADIVENPDQFPEISLTFDPKRALRQIASGLRHLHALKLIHRDIKPQNILVSGTKSSRGGQHRMLISDFGLCKKLDVDQTSFLPTGHGAMAAGTVGWRAPEILRGEVKLDEAIGDDQSQSSRGSIGTGTGTPSLSKPTRLTKSVDIFALGCLFYYTLTNGGHPFGDRFEREVNILKDNKNLDGLQGFGEEGSEAVDLIGAMLRSEASERPDTTTCLLHPFFWDTARRLTFLQDASDRFEIMCRDPRDPNLVALETGAVNIVGNDWHTRLDKVFIENLGKFRKYDGRSVQDLLRALRNKKHHYQDLPENVKRNLGPMPDGFLSYFTRRFPRLIMHVHAIIAGSELRQESMFRPYFELVDV